MSDLYANLSGNNTRRLLRTIGLLEEEIRELCERAYGPTIGSVEARERIERVDDRVCEEIPL